MRVGALLCFLVLAGVPSAVAAAECPGHPDAIGTSRVLVVDPAEHLRIGTMQYRETLPLNDHEVVLTFDDGPLPPYTTRVLETLAAQCVKATYFLVGRMARAYPEIVREIYAAGHSVGTHTQNHPYTFNHMAPAKAHQEIDDGIAAVTDALGDPAKVAPFFRIPGLIRADVVENYVASRGIQTWSADFPADDWRHISAGEVMHRALTRLEVKHKGVLLLHDIQPATAMMLPALLRELKRRGYRIVHVVPATASVLKTATTSGQWLMEGTREEFEDWPRFTVDMDPATALPMLPAPNPQSFGVTLPFGPKVTLARPSMRARTIMPRGQIPLPPLSLWPHDLGPPSGVIDSGLPAPSPNSFGYGAEIGPSVVHPDHRAATPAVPTAPVLPASTAPRADITGSVGTVGSGAHWPVTTSNMPTSGIP
jgi:peptidoglycan-N-acetylglucosamine deacetylase